MSALTELLVRQNESIPLDVAALQIATIEFPGLDFLPSLVTLDQYADELARRLRGSRSGREFVEVMNEFLFQELGFHGNEADYYDPWNSCLNQVLERRVGNPIALSVLYIEIARRLSRPVFGINLPRHFIVQYNDGQYATYIDPFHRGRPMDVQDCLALVRRMAAVEMERGSGALQPTSKRQIALRMLGNLRLIYFQRQNYSKATKVLDLLLQVMPDSAEEYKQRGVLHLQQRHYQAARSDLARYLELQPDAEDRAEVEEQLARIRKWMAGWN